MHIFPLLDCNQIYFYCENIKLMVNEKQEGKQLV